MKVVFTARAEQSLEEIGDWIATDNSARAVTFVRELRAAAQALAEFPHAFPHVERFERLDIRKRASGRYLILYRPSKQRIEIIDVVHGARDYHRLLEEFRE